MTTTSGTLRRTSRSLADGREIIYFDDTPDAPPRTVDDTRELDTNRSLYDALLQRYKEVGVAGGVGSTPVSIVDRADVPGGPYTPNLVYNLLIGFAIGLLGGVGVAIALEAMRMVEEGVASAADIDNAMVLGYKHPTGPLRTTDIVGLDVRLGIADRRGAGELERDLQ